MLSFLVFVSQNSRLATPFFEFCPVSLFLATLTSHVEANPSVCHSYKKHPGWGSLRLPLVISDQSPVTKFFIICTYEKRACNSFRIRTSKTRDLKPFRIRTYEKTGEGDPLPFDIATHNSSQPLEMPSPFARWRDCGPGNEFAAKRLFSRIKRGAAEGGTLQTKCR